MALSLLAALQAVKITIFGATDDKNFHQNYISVSMLVSNK